MKGPLAVALGLAALAVPMRGGAEDLTIVSTITTPRRPARTQTQYVSAARVRLSDGDRETIVDLASGKVTMLDPRRKQYSETSLDELRAFGDQIDAAMAGRAVFDRDIGATASVTVARDADGGRTIAGLPTEKYTLTLGESMRYEVWVAPSLPAPPQYFEARKAVYATLGPMARRFDRIFEEMKKIKGLPLASVSESRIRVGQRRVVIEATEVRRGPIPDSVFAVPSDYTKVDAPIGPGRAPRPRS
jgi:hypothetical protein